MAWRWAAGFGKLWILAGAEGHVNLGFSGWIMGVLVLGLVQMECSLVTLSHGEKTKSFLCTLVRKDSRYPPPRRCGELSDPRFHLLRRFQETLLNLSKLPAALLQSCKGKLQMNTATPLSFRSPFSSLSRFFCIANVSSTSP